MSRQPRPWSERRRRAHERRRAERERRQWAIEEAKACDEALCERDFELNAVSANEHIVSVDDSAIGMKFTLAENLAEHAATGAPKRRPGGRSRAARTEVFTSDDLEPRLPYWHY